MTFVNISFFVSFCSKTIMGKCPIFLKLYLSLYRMLCPSNTRESRVASIHHAIVRLPSTQTVSEISMKSNPVWSNLNHGTRYLQQKVNSGENIKIGSVLRPMKWIERNSIRGTSFIKNSVALMLR